MQEFSEFWVAMIFVVIDFSRKEMKYWLVNDDTALNYYLLLCLICCSWFLILWERRLIDWFDDSGMNLTWSLVSGIESSREVNEGSGYHTVHHNIFAEIYFAYLNMTCVISFARDARISLPVWCRQKVTNIAWRNWARLSFLIVDAEINSKN